MKHTLSITLLVLCMGAQAQHLNFGFTFQYHILKQVEVKSNQIIGARSYSVYNVIDNKFKFFTAGQSLVVGTIAQIDFKKFYFGIEPSFELNTYEYYVGYTISPTAYDKVRFNTLYLQLETPIYIGYMFKSSNLVRYSFYAGASPVMPYHLQADVKGDQQAFDRYDWADMNNILYSNKVYLNSVTGLAIHFASLGRLDFRYVHRLGSPGSQYQTNFNTVGAGLTFFVPLHLFKRKVYYEE